MSQLTYNKPPKKTDALRTLVALTAIVYSTLNFAKSDEQGNFDQLLSLSLEQLLELKIKVGSNVAKTQLDQPVTVSTISRSKIALTGARTVSGLINLLTPGYFLIEDQDDTIAGFRGLAPDNNSKVLLLLNGVNINTEWFWGPADSVLNGLDLEYIDRIEIIRGPGSVTQGQGALLGAINIITTDNKTSNLKIENGADGLSKQMLSVYQGFESGNFSLYLANGKFDGAPMANIGWSRDHIEQGLSVYQRQHNLHRSEYQNLLISGSYGPWKTNIFRFKQQRDLYNFYRDREILEQTIIGLQLENKFNFSDGINLKTEVKYITDDYALLSHGGNIPVASREQFESTESNFSEVILATTGADEIVERNLVMGGVREIRTGLKTVLNLETIDSHKIAFGLETNHFELGKRNSDGNNFIINEEIQILGLVSDNNGGLVQQGSPNLSNSWVKADHFSIVSLFLEDFYSINQSLDFFTAFRWDDHPNWGNQFTPRIGLLLRPKDKHFLRLSWQTGFRGAVGVQYSGGFVQDGFLAEDNFDSVNQIAATLADFDFDGDPTNDQRTLTPLQPETISTFELAHHYVDQNIQVRTVFFHNTVEDILAAQAHGYVGLSFGDTIGSDELGTWDGNWYYQNQKGKLTQTGVELEVDYSLDSWIFSFSHSNVTILSADDGVIGPYVLAGEKIAAYPANVSRFRITQSNEFQIAQLSWALTGLYYWDYFEPGGSEMNGSEIINFGVSMVPKSLPELELNLITKNITDTQSLYPINATGDADGAKGTPSIEPFSWWLSVSYQFK